MIQAGSGKTALAHLLTTGKPCKGSLRPTVGCNTTVILVDLPSHGDSQQQQAFIELWDVGACMHPGYCVGSHILSLCNCIQ